MAEDRTTTAFWENMRKGFIRSYRPVLDQYNRYSKWFIGDMADIEERVRSRYKVRGGLTLDNHTNLIVRSTRAQLMFRAPRFIVRQPETVGPSALTPDLARVETSLMNAWVQQSGFFQEVRRSILDGLLGPHMILKVGYSADIAVNDELLMEQRDIADKENQDFMAASKKMRVKPTDVDSVHVEKHDQLIAAIERGDLQVPEKALNYLRKHRSIHAERLAKGLERPTETIRSERVYIRRRSPLKVAFDPWAEGPDEREWYSEGYIARVEDVAYDFKIDPNELKAMDSRYARGEDIGWVSQDSIETPDKYTMVYEVVDLVKGKVIKYAMGLPKPLGIYDYTNADIMPGGPYITSCFMEDPIEDRGVPPPSAWEPHQIAASYMGSLNTTIAKRSVPKLIYNAEFVSNDELNEVKRALPAGYVPMRKLPPGSKVSDYIQQLEPCQIPEQNLLLEDRHKRSMEQYSGSGSAKLAGGDSSKTATASAVIAESTTSISEDLSAVLDQHLSEIGRAAMRLMRKYYTPVTVAEIVGEQSLKYWPGEWATRDIVDDRGVEIVPGSSQRKNIAVEQKLLSDFYTGAIAADPSLPLTLKIQMLKKVADSMGIQGLDFDGAEQEMMEQQMLMKMQAQMQGGPGGSEGPTDEGPEQSAGGPPGRAQGQPGRPSEAKEPSRAGQAQGNTNVGGGRIPTGAGQGDKPRFLRGG